MLLYFPVNYNGFESVLLEMKQVSHMTGNFGRLRSFSTIMLTGNKQVWSYLAKIPASRNLHVFLFTMTVICYDHEVYSTIHRSVFTIVSHSHCHFFSTALPVAYLASAQTPHADPCEGRPQAVQWRRTDSEKK